MRLKILDRYVAVEFLKAFLLALAGLVLIVEMMNVLDNIRNEPNKPPDHVALYLLFTIPQTTSLVVPAALMFSVCFVVAQLTVSREMVAVQSAGVPFFRGVAPILIFSGLLVIVMFFFQNFVVTPSNELSARELAIIRKNRGTVKDLIWQRNLRGREGYYFIYFLDREKLAIMGGFNYLAMQDGRPSRMLQAHAGRYRPESKDWVFQKVRIIEFTPEPQVKKITDHEEWTETLPDDIEFFNAPSSDPGEMTLGELWDEMARRKRLGIAAVQYQVQFHANIAFPLMSLVVALVGAVVGSMGNIRSGGPLFRSLLLSTATFFTYQMVFRLGQNLGNNGILPPPLAAWGPTGIAMALAGFLVYRNLR
ncbi:MAG: LptF/LptG family permease [Spirochaetia bacterium]|nr:LptF/LptG family permease [Spirochaetia bacterium]